MNTKFIYFISFLLGLFITLSILTLHSKFFYVNKGYKIDNFFSGYSYIENFDIQGDDIVLTDTTIPSSTSTTTTETTPTTTSTTSTTPTTTSTTPTTTSTTTPTPITDVSVISNSSNIIKTDVVSIPKKEMKFMLLTTYTNKIVNSEQKWYDENIESSSISSMTFNEGSYFVYNLPIDFYKNDKTNIIKGAIINKVQLKGPNALYFANNSNIKNYELSSFSVFFMLKINNIQENMTFFEMLANTSVVENDTQQVNYIANSISINIKINSTGNFDIQIIIGNSKYDVVNIDKKILIGTDISLIGLIFDGVNIKFIINNNNYTFKYTNNEIITLGSSPIIINKDGVLDGFLYSFIYYKTALTDEEILLLKNYNNYYIFGLYQTDTNKAVIENSLKTLQLDLDSKDAVISRLQEELNKCSNNNLLSFNSLQIPTFEKANIPLPSDYKSSIPSLSALGKYI
jgi:hypothetical protein